MPRKLSFHILQLMCSHLAVSVKSFEKPFLAKIFSSSIMKIVKIYPTWTRSFKKPWDTIHLFQTHPIFASQRKKQKLAISLSDLMWFAQSTSMAFITTESSGRAPLSLYLIDSIQPVQNLWLLVALKDMPWAICHLVEASAFALARPSQRWVLKSSAQWWPTDSTSNLRKKASTAKTSYLCSWLGKVTSQNYPWSWLNNAHFDWLLKKVSL